MIDGKYLEYSHKVLSNEIVAGKLIRLACQRYEDMFNREDIEFRTDKADRVVKFIQKLKHFQGKVAGKYFILEPWQKWVLYSIFGFYWKGTNNRVTTKVLLTMARKNGKSMFASGIALYGLIGDGESAAQVINVANNTRQAHILFEMEQKCARSIDPNHILTHTFRDSIKFDATDSVAFVLSSDATTGDGYNPHIFVCDETHEYKDSKLWDVLISGQGFRESPLAINISTSGFRLDGFLHQYRDTAVEILKGLKKDDTQFTALYELDDNDDWEDENTWIKANPNMDVTVTKKFIKEQITNAVNNNSLMVSVKTKTLNMWCSSFDTWIEDNYITESMKPIDLKDFEQEECYIGVDMSAVSDLTAWCVMFPPNENREKYPDKFVFKSFAYLPADTIENNINSTKYKDWTKQGYLIKTYGNVIDTEFILLEQKKVFRDCNLITVAYDAWNALSWAVAATNEGLPLEPYSQSLGNFNRPTKLFEILVKQNKVVIDNNPITRWCFQNVELMVDHNANCKPAKSSGEKSKKIDIVISMLECLGAYYDKGGIDITIA